jgi:hypothetical protein
MLFDGFIATEYIVAPNQFDICESMKSQVRVIILISTIVGEGVGCQAEIYVSWPAIFIWFMPPIILGTTTLTYASASVSS